MCLVSIEIKVASERKRDYSHVFLPCQTVYLLFPFIFTSIDCVNVSIAHKLMLSFVHKNVCKLAISQYYIHRNNFGFIAIVV